MKTEPNQYWLALFTAFLSGAFSITGGYFVTKYQAAQNVKIKEKELKDNVYSIFLEKVNRKSSPLISKLLNLGVIADTVMSDGDIQSLEDKIEALLNSLDRHDAYWQLNSDFNILRLYGDKKTNALCVDILYIITFQNYHVNWDNYPKDIQEYYSRWKKNLSRGTPYGFQKKATGEEVLMVIMTSKLFQELIDHLRDTSIKRVVPVVPAGRWGRLSVFPQSYRLRSATPELQRDNNKDII